MQELDKKIREFETKLAGVENDFRTLKIALQIDQQEIAAWEKFLIDWTALLDQWEQELDSSPPPTTQTTSGPPQSSTEPAAPAAEVQPPPFEEVSSSSEIPSGEEETGPGGSGSQ